MSEPLLVRVRRLSIARALARFLDIAMVPGALMLGPALSMFSKLNGWDSFTRRILDWFKVSVIPHHYYEPVVLASDLIIDPDTKRNLPGIDLNAEGQLALISKFDYRIELEAIPFDSKEVGAFCWRNPSFTMGDAEMFYNIIRYFKPRRIFEIGAGNSTLIARLAIAQNLRDDSSYSCWHVCVEPYEQPWLEAHEIEVRRERVERIPLDFLTQLDERDILFIDSSHVVRTQGDVVFELLQLVPAVKPGVLVHIHDIFTPRDYPKNWILYYRHMWGEQYLLEALLSFNKEFEVIAAVNWLAHEHKDKLLEACPILIKEPWIPSSFWIRRRDGNQVF
jgi:hypothetical protein